MAAAALVLVLVVGCAATPEDEAAPRVSIFDIEPLDLNLFAPRYVVTLHIHNRRGSALNVNGLRYVIRLNGEVFGSGMSDEAFTVPPHDDRLIQLVVVSDLVRLLEQFRTLARQENPRLRYGVEGDLSLEGLSRKMPFRYEEELPLPRRGARDRRRAI